VYRIERRKQAKRGFYPLNWYNLCVLIWPARLSSRRLFKCPLCFQYNRYTHKTSGFKTSGFKTSGFKTSETSGLQNVRFTKRQVYKMSGLQNVRSSKRPVEKKTFIDILYLWLVENRRFCCSHVCRQSDGCVLFSILEGFLPYITIISNNDTLFTLNSNANLAIPILFV
jgi:hypothetical protein